MASGDPLTVTRQSAIASLGYDCFISYSRQDAAHYTLRLWDALENRGMTVCLDDTEFDPGERLMDAMRNRVRAAKFVIYLDTINARKSPYVAAELRAALDTGRDICPIEFPAVVPAGEPWHGLATMASDLKRFIAINETCDPRVGSPLPRTIASLVARYQRALVRRRVRQIAAAVVLLLAVIGVWTLLSTIARTRTENVDSAFRDPVVPLQSARDRAGALLHSGFFSVDDFYAGSGLLRAATLLADVMVKQRSPVGLPAPDASATCDADRTRPPALSGMRCVASLAGRQLSVYVSAAASLGVWSWTLNDWARKPEPWSGVYAAAISRDHVATAGARGITIMRWTEPASEKQSVAPSLKVGGLLFAADGDLLVASSEDDSSPRASVLSLLDAATGVMLQQHLISARTASSVPAAPWGSCPDLQLAPMPQGKLIALCREKSWVAFEYAPPAGFLRYRTDRTTQGASIAGALAGPANTLAYWTSDNVVALCRSDGSCKPVQVVKPDEPDDPVMSVKVLAIATQLAGGYPASASVQRKDRLLECPNTDESVPCREASWSFSELLPGGDGEVLALQNTDTGVSIGVPQQVPTRLPLRSTSSERARAEHVLAAVAHASYIAWSTGGMYAATCGPAHDVQSSDFQPPLQSGAHITAAALSPSGCRAAVALESARGTFIYVQRNGWLPFARPRWAGVPARGSVLAVRIGDDAGEVEVVERWSAGLVRRTIDFGAYANN